MKNILTVFAVTCLALLFASTAESQPASAVSSPLSEGEVVEFESTEGRSVSDVTVLADGTALVLGTWHRDEYGVWLTEVDRAGTPVRTRAWRLPRLQAYDAYRLHVGTEGNLFVVEHGMYWKKPRGYRTFVSALSPDWTVAGSHAVGQLGIFNASLFENAGIRVVAASGGEADDSNVSNTVIARLDNDFSIEWSTRVDIDSEGYAASIARAGSDILGMGVAGKLDKFGAGDASIWLARLDEDGKQVSSKLVGKGRVTRSGNFMVAGQEGPACVWTTNWIPPICEKPFEDEEESESDAEDTGRFPLSFDNVLVAFTEAFEPRWGIQLPPSSSLRTPQLCRIFEETMGLAGVVDGRLWVAAISEAGDLLWSLEHDMSLTDNDSNAISMTDVVGSAFGDGVFYVIGETTSIDAERGSMPESVPFLAGIDVNAAKILFLKRI